MKRLAMVLMVAFLLIITALPASAEVLNLNNAGAQPALAGKKVALDPGHGGSDSGASYRYSDGTALREKDINLAVGLELQKKLEANGATVTMTRDKDTALSLSKRVSIANGSKADVLISIHHNALSNRNIDGVETFYSQSDDQVIAKLTYDELTKVFKLPKRGVQRAPGFALTLRPTIPSTLTEGFFVTNPKSAAKFSGVAVKDFGQLPVVQDEAQALYNALEAYCLR